MTAYLSEVSRSVSPVPQGVEPKQIAHKIIDEWPSDVVFDAQHALAEHPDLQRSSSAVFELAFEEYHSRRDAGQTINPDSFLERFPTAKRALRQLLDVETFLNHKSEKLAQFDETQWPGQGQHFLGFELIEQLGSGVKSRVFLARELDVGERLVVVKICKRGRHEAHALGKLQHANIGPILSVRHDAPTRLTAICMPYLTRSTLGHLLDAVFSSNGFPKRASAIVNALAELHHRQGSSDAVPTTIHLTGSYVDGVVQLGIQLADALAASHSHGICHCDMKPSNVLVSADGRAVLIDFNLSYREAAQDQTFGGTPPYAAPEILQWMAGGRRGRPTDRYEPADLFSLGATLYELLSGQPPFDSVRIGDSIEDQATVLLERQRFGYTSVRKHNPDVDPEFDHLLARCLAFDPHDRPGSAEEVAEALRSLTTLPKRANRWVRRHRLWAVAACLVAALAVSAFAASVVTREPNSVRKLQQGWLAYNAGQFGMAATHFENAVDNDPQLTDGPALAWTAFWICQHTDRKDKYQTGVRLNELALQRGIQTAAVSSNLGHCYLRIGDLDRAESHLQKAIQQDGKLQAGYHNLIKLDLQKATRDGMMPNIPLVQKALKTGPMSAELLFDSAQAFALHAQHFSKSDPENVPGPMRAIVGMSQQALEQGMSIDNLDALEALFPGLRECDSFQQLRRTASPVRERLEPSLLANPIGTAPELIPPVTGQPRS